MNDDKYSMSVKFLKQLLVGLPDDMKVFVGCKSRTNFKSNNEPANTFVIEHNGSLFLVDEFKIDIGNGEII